MSRSVVHLLIQDVARGAQEYAAEVCSRLSDDDWHHEVLTIFDGEARGSRFRSLGIPADNQPHRGVQIRAVRRLRGFLRDNNTAMVVAHGSGPLLYAALAAPRSTRVVYYRIGVSGPGLADCTFLEGPGRWARRRVYRLMVRRCSLVLGVSQETLEDSQRVFGVEPDRLQLVPNGRDPSPFVARTWSQSEDGPVRLLWVSHMTAHKRPEWFLSVVSQLRQRGLLVEATMVGDGPLLAEFSATEPIEGVQLLGRRDDVPDLMDSSDVFCFTSEGENEGMPGVLIGAGMAGLPSVSTRVPGASTIVEHGVTGLLAGCDDFDGFVAATANLVGDAQLRQDLGKAAARRCSEQFTLDASAALFQKALSELA